MGYNRQMNVQDITATFLGQSLRSGISGSSSFALVKSQKSKVKQKPKVKKQKSNVQKQKPKVKSKNSKDKRQKSKVKDQNSKVTSHKSKTANIANTHNASSKANTDLTGISSDTVNIADTAQNIKYI